MTGTKEVESNAGIVELSCRAVALSGYLIFVFHAARAMTQEPSVTTGLWFLTESFTTGLLLFARLPTAVTRTPYAITIAGGATFYYLFVDLTGGTNVIPNELAIAFLIVGGLFSLYAKVHLGRSFALLPANRGVVTSGPYRLVRHPIYLGYFIGGLGFLLTHLSVRNAMLFGGQYLLQVLRIYAEERVLVQDAEYAEYTKKTRFRVVPFVF